MKEFKGRLDAIEAQIRAGEIPEALDHLAGTLFSLRMDTPDSEWSSKIRPLIESHPLSRLVLEDPFTYRSNRKPRGYAGDAVMLDYIYLGAPPADTTPLGVSIFSCTTSSSVAQSVKWRAERLGQQIDQLTRQQGDAKVLSLACGHLREVMFSQTIKEGLANVTVHALDQDVESLAQVQRDYGHLSTINLQKSTVKDLLKGKVRLAGFDLAYAAGLYDYLSEPVAKALTSNLFSMLAPGGKLLIPNFLANNPGRGYMESFMDWHLVVRSPNEIQGLASALPAEDIASQRYYEDPFGAIGYLEVVRSS